MTADNKNINKIIKFLKEYQFPIGVGLAMIVSMSVVIYLSLSIISPPDISNNPDAENLISYGWLRWDYGWYRNIAENGYTNFIPAPDSYDIKAFFPFYPLIIKLFGLLFGSLDVSALIISRVSFVLALILLFKIVKVKFGEKDAKKTLILLCAFPFSFYFIAAYTESLFLLLTLLAFYFADKKRWIIAAFFAACASATKTIGVFVSLSLLIFYLDKIDFNFKKIKADIFYLFLGFAGILGYMYYLAINFGKPFAFLDASYTWIGKDSTKNLIGGLISFWSQNHSIINTFPMLHLTFQFFLAVIFFYLLLRMFKRDSLGKGYLSYSLLVFIVSSKTFIGMGRYLIVIFPLFVVFARFIKNDNLLMFIAYFFVLLQFFFAFLFSHSFWVA